jgi:hypothetical protein
MQVELNLISGGFVARTVQGKQWTWQLGDRPIGSGDAGEVFAVTCLEEPGMTGVLKKPARIATGGTIQRQAGQIAREGRALAELDGLAEGKAHPPRLLDEAPVFTQGTARYFIVSENASGTDLAAMLIETRQKGLPFPRRVIITVLDALFDLFSRAHKTGILWNDVKLDHIFWNNKTGHITIIDWGNALFLNDDSGGGNQAGERWEDYRQMIATLGGFLRQTAPELYQDLGWEAFQSSEMNGPVISVLARRIAYQQQVIALKVMEYQALINVVLSTDPTLEGLEKIREYQTILNRIGAPWKQQAVLDYGSTLVDQLITDRQTDSAIRATALVWEMFPEGLGLNWHLIREIFRHPDLLQSPSLSALVNQIMAEHWSEALWILIGMGKALDAPPWWDNMIPVLRQKALGLVTPPPLQICQSLLIWFQQQQKDADKIHELQAILSEWRRKGIMPDTSPFDYEILDILQENPEIPLRIQAEIKKSFAAGREGIRAILQTWVNLDWEGFPKAFRRVAGWDPDRWGLIQLADEVHDFKRWLDELAEGPGEGQSPASFLSEMKENRPRVENILGKPGWLRALLTMLETLITARSIEGIEPAIRTWCPWLLSHPSLDDIGPYEPVESEVRPETLENFIRHLKAWSDVEGALARIRSAAPDHFSDCQTLVGGFDQLMLLSRPEESADIEALSAHPILDEAACVIRMLTRWRHAMMANDLEKAWRHLNEAPAHEWRLWQNAHDRTRYWQEVRIPLLESLSTHQDEAEFNQEIPIEDHPLLLAKDHLEKTFRNFDQITEHGLHLRLVETLEEDIETAREGFLRWRQTIEKSENRMDTLIYHSHLPVVREISSRLSRLSEHIRKVRLSFTILTTLRGPVSVQLAEGEKVMAHLAALENLLKPEGSPHPLQDWKAAFHTLLQAENSGELNEHIRQLDPDHPLYTWMAQLRRQDTLHWKIG